MKLFLEPGTFSRNACAAACVLILTAAGGHIPEGHAQQASQFPLGDGPWIFDTYAPQTQIRVSVVTKGLTHPWGLAFLPNGDMLVSERGGTLRIVRDGKLDPKPIAGLPEVAEASSGGLMDIALHPDFASNRWVYFVYAKPGEPKSEDAQYWAATAVGRGRFTGTALTDVEDVFVPDAWSSAPGGHGTRILFAPDGTFFVGQPHRRELERAQNTMDHVGTILRLRDDGSVPPDNPFVGKAGHRPEIYSYGHRVVEGLAFHPETGQLWATEHGPQGGDELNIIVPGGNYGWPVATQGLNYDGTRLTCEGPCPEEGMQEPDLFWVPSIAPSGTMFYTGDRFPEWQGNVFVGSMRVGGIVGTGHVQRLVFGPGGVLRREQLLRELRQRIRDVKQGPDGLIYVLTEEPEAALLRIEPMN